jgi:predicted N-acetyltransferase YhbS
MTYRFVSLRDEPQHLPTVAGWIHGQWWSDTDISVVAIKRWLRTHLGGEGFPSTVVAVAGDEAIGSVSLHETEAEDRPAFTPYLGALFVRPGNRGEGVGAALVRAVEAHARRLGHDAVYLNAADPVAGLYETLGWEVVERGYGPKQLNIMRRRL